MKLTLVHRRAPKWGLAGNNNRKQAFDKTRQVWRGLVKILENLRFMRVKIHVISFH